MQVTKRTFLKGLLATAAAGGVVSQASAKPQADLPAKWDREADVVILGYGGAGASAAITAKDAGADVVIFEKTAGRRQHSRFLRRHDDPEQPRTRYYLPCKDLRLC